MLNAGGALGQALAPMFGGGNAMSMMTGSGLGNIAGGFLSAQREGGQYTPESLVQDALSGVGAGFQQFMNPSSGFSSNVGRKEPIVQDTRLAPSMQPRHMTPAMQRISQPIGQGVTVQSPQQQQAATGFSMPQFMQNTLSAWERFGG